MVKIMENPIKIDDFGVPLFSETVIYWSLERSKKKNSQMTTWASEKSTHNWLDVDRIHISQQNLYTTDV